MGAVDQIRLGRSADPVRLPVVAGVAILTLAAIVASYTIWCGMVLPAWAVGVTLTSAAVAGAYAGSTAAPRIEFLVWFGVLFLTFVLVSDELRETYRPLFGRMPEAQLGAVLIGTSAGLRVWVERARDRSVLLMHLGVAAAIVIGLGYINPVLALAATFACTLGGIVSTTRWLSTR